ncbi:MAG TPA: hypothetical protein VJI15_01155 [Candidatus Nanoarchaeia archaeon]|nr:hypothetical protein [Candidatus Nanoarchaeia archaeon]
MPLPDWITKALASFRTSQREWSPLEDQLKDQLTAFAEQDQHRVKVYVLDQGATCTISYHRQTDQALVDQVASLPLEVREQHGWTGRKYLETLLGYTHPLELTVDKKEASLGGLMAADRSPRQTGFYMALNCRSPLGLDIQDVAQLSVYLGQFAYEDRLSAPRVECLQGELKIRLFYRGSHEQLDEEFARRIYEAFETVYAAVSLPSELKRRVDAVVLLPFLHHPSLK